MANLNLGQIDSENWLEVLPVYQRTTIQELLASGKSEEDVLELWLNRAGPEGNAGFGVGAGLKTYCSNFVAEIDAFLCGDEAYDKQRAEASDIWQKQGKTAFVAIVAGFIGAKIGLTAVALFPVVALVLSLVGKMGLGAYCKTRAAK